MSIAMLEDPFKTHDILDDLESIFWSILYGAIKYFSGTVTFDMKAFFSQSEIEINGRLHVVGGGMKKGLLESTSLTNIPFDCAPLRELISHLSRVWRKYYRARVDVSEAPSNEEARQEYETQREKLSKPAFWLDIFDQLLKRSDWLAADTIADRYPPKPAKKHCEEVREQLLTAVIASEGMSRPFDHDNHNDNEDNDDGDGDHDMGLLPVSAAHDFPARSCHSELSDVYETAVSSPLRSPPEPQDMVFPRIPASPPKTVSNTLAGSGSEGSAPSLQLNSNRKRTMSARGGDDEESTDGGIQSPLPTAKRPKKSALRSIRADETGKVEVSARSSQSRSDSGSRGYVRSGAKHRSGP